MMRLIDRLNAHVERQGTIIVERDDDGGGFLVMTPSGDIFHARTRRHVEQIARREFRSMLRGHTGAIGVGTIEWRD